MITPTRIPEPITIADAPVTALLRCAIRELADPAGRTRTDDEGRLRVTIGGGQVRAQVSGGMALDMDTAPEILDRGDWRPLSLDDLISLVERELPGDNTEFTGQVRASRDALLRLAAHPAQQPAPDGDPVVASWLRSEQSLIAGHPFHPSPKAHLDGAGSRYAPECGAQFPLRLIGVPTDLAVEYGDARVLDTLAPAPEGHLVVPVHPWQADVFGIDDPTWRPAGVVDLGETDDYTVPTSSVRTVYLPRQRQCLKLSLHVRITNCVRKNAWYELAGAVELTRRLRPIASDLADRFPGTRILAEPGARSVGGDHTFQEAVGVVVRDDPTTVTDAGVVPVVAAAIAQPDGEHGARKLAGADIRGWWDAYLRVVALPVLYAFTRHGVAFEAHAQNTLVGVDSDGVPRQLVLRDLEGTKLISARHDLTGLPQQVAAALTYDPDVAWRRVVYCLVVNQLAHVAAALADRDAELLDQLWRHASDVLTCPSWADEAIASLGRMPTVPAKANLAVRWSRSPDRAAGYITVPNPLWRDPAPMIIGDHARHTVDYRR